MSRDDMDGVLDEGIRSAVRLLEKNREFYPFGIAKADDGEITHVQGYMEEDCPSSSNMIDVIVHGLRQGAEKGRYLTAAVVSDVRLRDRSSGQTMDAIRVDIEDQEQHAITCYVPYEQNDSNVNLGEIVAESASPTIFL